jgi:nitrite reductase/ring-hydroxylating ferredoxin subunit
VRDLSSTTPDARALPASQDETRRIDRRRFLCTVGSAAALAAGGDWLARGLAEREAAEPPLALVAADADGLAVGEARAVHAEDGREALVVRLDASSVVAFDRRCPHLGCPVLWSAERARFECPCHHAAFDARTGAVLFGPPRRALARAEIQRA